MQLPIKKDHPPIAYLLVDPDNGKFWNLSDVKKSLSRDVIFIPFWFTVMISIIFYEHLCTSNIFVVSIVITCMTFMLSIIINYLLPYALLHYYMYHIFSIVNLCSTMISLLWFIFALSCLFSIPNVTSLLFLILSSTALVVLFYSFTISYYRIIIAVKESSYYKDVISSNKTKESIMF